MENFAAKIGSEDNIAFAIYSLPRASEDESRGVRGDNRPCSRSSAVATDGVKRFFPVDFLNLQLPAR